MAALALSTLRVLGLPTSPTYTGTTISDNATIPVALQELETALESGVGDAVALRTLTGTLAGATDMGTFTGALLPDTQTIKSLFQVLETEAEAVRTSQGIASGAVNFGTFTGALLTDNLASKALFQELETALEAANSNVADILTAIGIVDNAVDLGTFTGTTIPDASTVKVSLQSLETAVENAALTMVAEVAVATTASEGTIVPVNVSAGNVTITPPAGVAGAVFGVSDSRGVAATNAFSITVDFAGAAELLNGASDTLVIDIPGTTVLMRYVDATVGWVVQ